MKDEKNNRVGEYIVALLASRFKSRIAFCREIAASPAVFSFLPGMTAAHGRLLSALGIERIYSHQAEAVVALRGGRDACLRPRQAAVFMRSAKDPSVWSISVAATRG